MGCSQCENTVTFHKHCVNPDELNYAMFGLGMKLRNKSPAYFSFLGFALAHLHSPRDPPDVIKRKVEAAHYGYNESEAQVSNFEWPGSCAPSEEKWHSNPVLSWFWWGLGDYNFVFKE